MKTRIVHTKIWEDDEYLEYSKQAKLLFMYCITNHRIGFTGMYELPEKSLQFSTGLKPDEIEKAKKELEKSIVFYKGYVFVRKAGEYSGFNSPKHKIPREREVNTLPEDVRNVFLSIDRGDIAYRYPMDRVFSDHTQTPKADTDKPTDRVSIGYPYPTDTLINNKYKTINNKVFEGVETLPEELPQPLPETIEDSAQKIIEEWNKVFGSKYSSIVAIVDNLKYWLKVYHIEQILEGIPVIKTHHFWRDKMKPETYLRQKNTNGEKVDYIGEMLNYKPRKDFSQENKSKYDKL